MESTLIDGRYAIDRELGLGSMGRVLLVKGSDASGVPAACKVLEDESLLDAFIEEYRLLRRLSHPSFVGAHELGIDRESGKHFLVCEFCPGPSLAESGLEGEQDPIAVAAELLRAVDHLHRLGYVHGDLAPPNVLWGRETGTLVKIIDLGAAGARGSGAGSTSGVLAYVAPERLEGRALHVASDLWSLGALLFELIFGRHPWPGYPARGPAKGKPDRSGLEAHPLDPVLDRLLASEPDDRYASAAAALADVEVRTGRELPLVTTTELARRLRATPFVDVGGHLATLGTRLTVAAEAGEGAVVRIGGPAGSGRSRLLGELASELAAARIHAVLERFLPGDRPGAVLRRVVAAVGGDPATIDEAASASALAQAVIEAVRRGDGAQAVMIDGVGGADELTAEAVEALARHVTTRPTRCGGLLLAVADARGDEELRPWSADEVGQLLEALFPGRRVGARVAEPLRRASGGNPELCLAILERLAESGALWVDAAAIHLDKDALGSVDLPASLEAAAQARLATLGEELRTEAALLGHSLQPLPPALLDVDAAALVDAGLAVLVDGPGGAALVPASEAIRSAAGAGLDDAEAHRTLAARWRRRGPETSEARIAACRHRLAAGDEGAVAEGEALLEEVSPGHAGLLVEGLVGRGWPKRAEAALKGADAAAAAGKAEQAIELCRLAVELADGEGDDLLAARALARLGALQAHQARHAGAVTALDGALERGGARLGERDRAEILAGLSRCAVLSGDVDAAETRVDEALELVGDDAPGLRGRLLYTRALVWWYRGEMERAAGAFERARRDVEGTGDLVELAAIVTGEGLVAHRRGAMDEAVRRYTEALTIGERAGDDARVLTALQNLGVVHHETGSWTEALDTYREALVLAEALGQRGRVIQLAGNLGNLWRFLGELGEARAILARGLELAVEEQNRLLEGIIETLLGEVALADEDWDGATTHLEAAVKAAEASQSAVEEVEARLDLARLHLERQSYEQAREAAGTALELAQRIENDGLIAQARALFAAGHLRSIHGDEEEGAGLLQRALDGVEAIPSPDNRWPVLLEGFWGARRRADREEAERLAKDVEQILRQLEDQVPAAHRQAFRRLRERSRARLQIEPFTEPALEGAGSSRAGVVNGRWERLLEVNKRLSGEHDVGRLLEYIMDSAIILTGAERGFLLLADEDAGDIDLEIKVARNIDQENIRNTRFKISRSIAKRAIESGEPVLTVDAMEDSRYREQLSVHDLRLRSVLSVPMRMRGRVLGAIYLDNRFRVAAFGEEDLHFMEAFADQAGIALNNAQLLTAKERSQAELERARSEVEALNRKLAEQLKERTRELEDTHRVVIRQRRQLEARYRYENIIGNSEAIRAVFAIMDRLLDNTVPVLIEGESGTGKELVARAIHFNGTRKDKPFVAINCGAIPANLLESELFGHVRGAFTGATGDKKGLFEAAHGGTLLLDELGELPLEMQVKLLRVLQNGEIKKVGSAKEITVDVRIVAATNRRLQEEVEAGRFREDLYYRLSVVPIALPPLRQRTGDIPLLIQHFIAENRAAGLGKVSGVSPAALSLLQSYGWPGNVRQLEMVLKNASLFAESEILQPEDFLSFPEIVGGHTSSAASSDVLAGRSLADIEREAIIQALKDNRGNKKRSAEQLGIDRRTLYNKLKAYNIVIEKELHVV